MDFFNQQENAHKSTKRLIFLFALAVIGIIFVVYVALALTFGSRSDASSGMNLELLAAAAAGTLLVVGFGSLYKVRQLSQGGKAVATMMGGTLVNVGTRQKDERRLLNVVDEMAIAAGIPAPQVFILQNEPGINAFAAGFSPSDAVIGVTQGCLAQFTRDELQGVIGHEFSHILNGDMRLNLRLMGILFGITCIATAGYIIMRSGRYGSYRSRKNGGGILFLGLGLLIAGSIGTLFAKLIKAAVSRQREFLADASAVQFTRNPSGIGNALKKLAGFSTGGKLRNPHASEASHMFFAHALSAGWDRWFSTHPPMTDRIKAIDPLFAKFKDEKPRQGHAGSYTDMPGQVAGFSDATIDSIGQVTAENIAYGEGLIRSLPLSLTVALRDPFSARALAYCLILSGDSQIRREQIQALQEEEVVQTVAETMQLHATVQDLGPGMKIPLLDLIIPTLRSMSFEQYQNFRANMKRLTGFDNKVSLLEFAIEKIFARHLDAAYLKARPSTANQHSLSPLLPELSVVLSVLAHSSHGDAEAAFAAGRKRLQVVKGSQDMRLLPSAKCHLGALDKALNRLGHAVPARKRTALQAFAATVAHDDILHWQEAEALRAVADALDCPMPPLPGVFRDQTAQSV